MKSKRRILITGGTGLIGSKVIPLLSTIDQVFILTRKGDLSAGFSSSNITPIQIDLSTEWRTEQLPEKIDTIIHLSQSEHFREFPQQALEIFSVNTLSTLKLMDYARSIGVKKFIYASSGGVYGHGDNEFTEEDEGMRRKEIGFYLDTKFCSEVLVQNFLAFMDVIILRFFFVYGKGQRKTMLIPRLVESVEKGTPIVFQGVDGVKINPIHVNDASVALVKAMNLTGSHKINVAGPEVLSIPAIANIIGNKLGKKPIFDFRTADQAQHLVGDIQKMKKLLHTPGIHFSDGIEDLIR